MNNLKKDIEYFIKNIYYIIPVILTAILSFGFVITHYSVNIDTLSYDRYCRQGEFLAQSRFGPVLLDKIFHVIEFNPFFVEFIAVTFLIVATIVFCILFKKVTNSKLKMITYTIFACLFLSYPLINEIFVYTPASIIIGLGYFGIAVSLNFMYKYLLEGKIKYAIYTTIILTLILASYESFASVYLCGFCIMLILDCIFNEKNIKFKQTAKKIIKLIIPILIAIILGKIISTILMKIYNLTPSTNAAKQIIDLSYGLWYAIKKLIKSNIVYYLPKLLFYLPITIMGIAVIINFVMNICYSIKRKNLTLFLLFLGTIFSIIALSIIQGSATPCRACQVYALFIAFTFMLLLQSILQLNFSKIFKNIAIVLMFVLVFFQAKNLHKWFFLNYLRYQEEKIAITTIANDIQIKCDTSKPVVFVGNYYIPQYIYNKVCMNKEDFRYKVAEKIISKISNDKLMKISPKIVQTNINSYINWGMISFEGQGIELLKWLEMLGYNFKPGDMEMNAKAKALAEQLPKFPKEGYILETEDFIIVNMQ